MAINKYMRAALKALSNAELDIKANYKLIRQIERAAKKPHIKPISITMCHSQNYFIDIANDNYSIPVRIFTPPGKETAIPCKFTHPSIIFFHGGGWVTGDLDSYEKTCSNIAKQTRHIVIAVEYRLAPENPFPAALTDCYNAVKSIIGWYDKSDNPHEKITLMGDSAGGNLAAAVSLYMRDNGDKLVSKQILIYPSVHNDHTTMSPFPSVVENGTDYLLTIKRVCDYVDLYCSKQTDRSSHYFAPLLSEDFSNQPDTLILTAQYDLLRDEAEEYGKKLKEAGNNVRVHRIEDALHGYFSLPVQFSAVKKSYIIINRFLVERVERKERKSDA